MVLATVSHRYKIWAEMGKACLKAKFLAEVNLVKMVNRHEVPKCQ